jgi:hypothetical protein
MPSQNPEHRHRPLSQKPVPPPQLASALGSMPRSSLGRLRVVPVLLPWPVVLMVPGVGSAEARRDRPPLARRRRRFIVRACGYGGAGE